MANQFAGQAAGGGVKLEKWHVHSQLIGINCYTNYHYSIMVNSIFPHLRSALLYRLCLVIHNMASKLPLSAPAMALLPVSDIYECLLVLLPGYHFASFEAVSKTFAYNPVGDPGSAVSFSLVSIYIKAFVRANGTGRSGGVNQPNDIWGMCLCVFG